MFKDLEGSPIEIIAAEIGGLLLAPLLLPLVVGIARPILKGVIKTGLMTMDAARESFAGLREAAEDVMAEARTEISVPESASELAPEGPTARNLREPPP